MWESYERLLAPLLALSAAALLACYALGVLLGTPLPTEILLATLMVIGLPELMSRRLRCGRMQRAFYCLVGAACAAGLAWRTWQQADEMLLYCLAVLMALASLALTMIAFSRAPPDGNNWETY